MSAEWLVGLLASGGFSAVLAALVAGLFSRRKIGAEATKIITDAAAGVVTNMQSEVKRQASYNKDLVRKHSREMRSLIESHAAEMDDVRRVLQLHVAWDAIAIAKMAEVGIELPPAPPLLPARRHYDHHDFEVDYMNQQSDEEPGR